MSTVPNDYADHFLSTIDYAMLAEQKTALVQHVEYLWNVYHVSRDPLMKPTIDAVQGIVHLLDALQDTAESIGLLTEEE